MRHGRRRSRSLRSRTAHQSRKLRVGNKGHSRRHDFTQQATALVDTNHLTRLQRSRKQANDQCVADLRILTRDGARASNHKAS